MTVLPPSSNTADISAAHPDPGHGWSIAAQASLAAACDRLAASPWGYLAVVDGSLGFGLVSTQAVLRAIAAGDDPAQTPVAGCMVAPVPTLQSDQSVTEQRSRLLASGFPVLPLVSPEGQFLSLVAMPDLRNAIPTHQPPRLYAQLVEQSPNPIFSVDAAGRIQSWNLACEETFLHGQEVVGRLLHEVLQPVATGISFDRAIAQVFSGKTFHHLEIVYRTSTFAPCFMVSQLYPLHNGDGRICRCAVANTNVTQLKHLEAQLSSNKRYFHTLFERAPVGICQSDLSGHIQRANPWFLKVLGYSEPELLALTFQEVTHPEDLEQDLTHFRQLLQGEIQSYSIEKRYLCRDGTPWWVLLTVCRLENRDGTCYGTLGITQDIRDRKRAEADLHQSQERYALATTESQVGVWDWDLKTNDLYLSPNLKAMLGYADHEIANHIEDWLKHVHPDDHAATLAAAQAHLAGERDRYEVTHRMIHKDGSTRWILARGTMIRDADGIPSRMAGTDTDITEMKQIEAALRQSHQHVADILESITDGFFALDQACRFTYVNQQAEALLRTARHNLIGHAIWTRFPAMMETLFFENFYDAVNTRESRVFEAYYTPFATWYEVHAYPTPTGLAVYFQDISDRKRSYEQLQHQIQREKALNQVIQAIRQSLNLDTVFSTAAQQMGPLLSLNRVSIVQYVPHDRCWRILASLDLTGQVMNQVGATRPDVNNPIADQLRRGQVVCIDDVEFLEDPINRSLAGGRAEAWLLVPIMVGDALPWGSFSLSRSRELSPWQPAEIELAQTIADQLAIAIQQAQSYERARQELAERRRAETRLKAAQRLARLGHWDLHIATDALIWSEELLQLFGLETHQTHPQFDPWQLIHPGDMPLLRNTLDTAQSTGEPFQLELRFVPPDRHLRYVQLLGEPEYNGAGELVQFFGTVMDITERRLFEDQLAYEAYHDALTGLPNRTFFMETLQTASDRARSAPDYDFAVLFIDLDRFKVINDSLGHLMGDKLLTACTQRLSQAIQDPSTQFLARLSGDEFAVLHENIDTTEEAIALAQRIHDAMLEPFSIDRRELFVSISIGISSSLSGSIDPVDCLREADIAMFKAKGQGRARSVVFDPRAHSQDSTRLALETDLQRAIDREELTLVYQPVVCLKTGRLAGFEALARWEHRHFGPISPTEFIPLAEENGFILRIGRWTRHQACSQLRTWQQRYANATDLTVSVNLSVKQFASLNLLSRIIETLEDTGLPSQNLRLEITESAVIDNPALAADILKTLRGLGIQLCIDDFGTGYSSLSMLHQYPLQVLKIDRSFVNRLEDGDRGIAMVRTILALAHNLSMETIAEGVETAAQLQILQQLGCESAQGYFFAKPLTATDAERLIAEDYRWPLTEV